MHSAVKIEPNYKNNLAIHVLDASRAVVVVQKLLNQSTYNEFCQDVRAEYDELRKEYYDSQKDKSFVSLAKARAKKMRVNWDEVKITKPTFLGKKVFKNYNLKKLVDFIDWDPFF